MHTITQNLDIIVQLLCNTTAFRTVFSKIQSVIFQILDAQTFIKMSVVLQ